jgi:hypothetical protein
MTIKNFRRKIFGHSIVVVYYVLEPNYRRLTVGRNAPAFPAMPELNAIGQMTPVVRHAHKERMENHKIHMRSYTETARKLDTDCGTATGILLSLLSPSILSTVLSVAQSLQRRHDDRHIKEVQPSEVTELTDGSLVVVNPHDNPLSGRRPATKFDPKWAGPYEIVSHSGNTYKLKDLIVADTFIDRHIRDLKPFRFDPRYTQPIDVVARERREMFVGEIIAHTGDPDKKKDMTFRVRWLWFAPDRDTYEPWSSLDSNTILHRYLINNNGMQKLIPPRFRDLYDTVVDPSRKRKRRGKEGG